MKQREIFRVVNATPSTIRLAQKIRSPIVALNKGSNITISDLSAFTNRLLNIIRTFSIPELNVPRVTSLHIYLKFCHTLL